MLFNLFHDKADEKIEQVVIKTSDHQWNDGRLSGSQLLSHGKHLSYCNRKGKGSILNQGDNFIRNGRQNLFNQLRQRDMKKCL